MSGFKAFIDFFKDHPNAKLITKVTEQLLRLKEPVDLIHVTVTFHKLKTVGGVVVYREEHPHNIPQEQKVRILMQIMKDLDLSWNGVLS